MNSRSVGIETNTIGSHLVVRAAFVALAGSLLSCLPLSDAAADPCEGSLPHEAGVTFSGVVRYVIDGDGWCVGNSADPNTWIEVRSADFDAEELRTEAGRRGKAIAERELVGRAMSCVSAHGRNGHSVTNHDRVFAVCRVGGRRVADVLRAAGVPQGGN